MAKGSDFRTGELPAWIEARGDGIVITLHVQPGARRTAVVGPHGERLKIAVSSPPADGRANAALLEFLAERLAIPKSCLRLLSGASSREKRVAIEGTLAASTVVAALGPVRGQ
ncbi:MAG: DUF167 domain-containing protein [Betaproteobacteria bacterium]